MAGGQHLLHLGSDVAWYQVGAPVYAIADGVVRYHSRRLTWPKCKAQ